MRALVQRVLSASVSVGAQKVGAIGPGLLVLAGVAADDEAKDVAWLSSKLIRLRLFADASGQMNRSVAEVAGGILLVSQFTLFASLRKGTRPSWSRAAPPALAQPMFERLRAQLEADLGRPVASGVFGADMQVASVNDGPLSLFIDTRNPE